MVTTLPTQPPVKLGIAEWSVPMAGPAACQLVAQAGLDGLQVDLGPAAAGYPMSRPLVRDAYQQALEQRGFGAITTEILADQSFYFAEDYHQQYLAKPGSRPYCSAMPTQTILGDFEGASYKLPDKVWKTYDWSIQHCVLRSDNTPIQLN